MTKERKKEYLISTTLIILLFALLMFLQSSGILNRYSKGIVISIFINIILAASLNVTVGVLGQISLGHAGFMSIGAYCAALFAKAGILTGIPNFIVSILIGAIFALIFGFLVGIPSLRLKGDYLAIITLAFGEIVRVLIEFFKFTGGAQGLSSIPTYSSISSSFIVMTISVVLMYSLMTSRHGRGALAIREDEIAAESVGVNTTRNKIFVFALSAMFAGVAGAMYAQYMGLLSARQFNYEYSINILVMVVLGGMGSFTGSILSAIGLTILPEVLRMGALQDYRMIIYSLALILVMIFRPIGLMGRSEFSIGKTIKAFEKRFLKKGGPNE